MKPSHELVKREPEERQLDRPTDRIPLNYNYGVDPNVESETHLLDYWKAIRKRIWLVLGIVALVTMLTAVYVARKPDLFEAQARVQVNLENSEALVSKGSAYYGPTDDPVYFNTQLQVLVSQGLLRRVVRTLDLEHNPGFLNGDPTQRRSPWQTILRKLGLRKAPAQTTKTIPDQLPLASSSNVDSSQEDLKEAKRLAPYVGRILVGLRVEPVKETRGFYKETRLIDIIFQHTDPEVAAKVVNAIAETYVLANLEKNSASNSTTGAFLQKRIAELQQHIRSDEEKLVNYAKNNQIVSLNPNQNTVVERLAGLNRQLLEAENDRKTAEAAYNAAKEPGAASALAEQDTKQVNELEDKLGDLKQKRAQLLVDMTEEAPEVKELDQQISVLDQQLKEMRSRKSSTILTNLNTHYRQTLEREQSLRKAFEQQRSETLTQNEASINYRIIQQEIDTNKTLLDNLLQKSKENDVVMASKENNISILDYALTPDNPVGPVRARTISVALFLSLGLGIAVALFLEYLDDTVHTTEEVERFLNLPALAMIPAMGSSMGRRFLAAPGALQKRNSNGNGENLNTNHSALLMNVDGRSPLAESYRHLRTSVLLSTAGRAPKSLLVTSSLPGEGKTTTAVNTAHSLGQTGATVLLIDADMRRPRLSSIFEMRDHLGLSSILSSDVTEEEILAMIEHDPKTGVNVLTSGPIPPNPAELLGSEQMRRLITILHGHFDHVVIDSPPISTFTDGVLIATMVDGVLLVVQGAKSSRHIVRRSKQLLKDVGAKILGVVLNNAVVPSHSYYYQHYYSQQYYEKNAGV